MASVHKLLLGLLLGFLLTALPGPAVIRFLKHMDLSRRAASPPWAGCSCCWAGFWPPW